MTPRPLSPLPIDDVLPDVLTALAREHRVVLRAPTGAGKTTRVAPAMLDAGLGRGKAVLLLEPRRIAARAAAARIAAERDIRLGTEVGYHVRFDRCATRNTKILVVTEGIFLRMLQDDPFLDGVGAVLFDEFHERRVDSDLALAMVQRLRREMRPDLPIVVMSATLEVEPVARWLDDAPTVTSQGRQHPVSIEYRTEGAPTEEDAIADAVADVLPRTRGDVLVFLPGVGEIRRTRAALDSVARRNAIDIAELYGALSPKAQDVVLRPGTRRRIILATNVAETSVTIPGVTAVVDSGWHRVLRRDAALGLDRLEREPISRASADQRAGRAGRIEAGICRRLWTSAEQAVRSQRTEPEIRRVDLAGPILQLAAWGESDFARFDWFESPSPESIDQAVELLRRLGALGDHGPTPLGRRLAKIPTHPRLGVLLLTGLRHGQLDRAALAAALLGERDPFPRDVRGRRDEARAPRGASTRRSPTACDLTDRIEALERFASSDKESRLQPEIARSILRIRSQLVRAARRSGDDERQSNPIGAEDAIRRAVLAAFPDRVARRREHDPHRAVIVGGRGVRLAPTSAVTEGPLFVCVDVEAGTRGERAEALVRLASSIEREWLGDKAIESSIEVSFDAERRRVVARKRTKYLDLTLEESPTKLPRDGRVEAILAEAILREPEPLRVFASRELETFVLRIRCLREWMPELELPSFDAKNLADALPTVVRGCRSFADLAKHDALAAFRALVPYEQLRAIDRHAPERIEVPSGSRIRLAYEAGHPPVLAARIQELFGLADTPRIADGRVAVRMHLLAPNQRPQQITDDLRSFWDHTYAEVRKELRRRYPKHSWPEDPWSATPERRPGRRDNRRQ